jgi:transcriptional regulator with XRE-family HTH domain
MTKNQLVRFLLKKLNLNKSQLARRLGVSRNLITKIVQNPGMIKQRDTSLALVRLCAEEGLESEANEFISRYTTRAPGAPNDPGKTKPQLVKIT